MTSVFDGYDEEYKSLTSDIQQKISQVSSYEDDAGSTGTSSRGLSDLLTPNLFK